MEFSRARARVPRSPKWAGAVIGWFVLTAAPLAQAQSNPAFVFVKPEDKPVSGVEWKVQVKGGAMQTTGNSQALTATFGGSASRKEGMNKLALDVNAAYGRQSILTFTDANANGLLDAGELTRTETTATDNWLAKGRYDRFLTTNNALYALGDIGADKIAGKKLFGGGQVGYSRQLFKNDMHLVVAEIGYDFTYEQYVTVPAGDPSSVSLHSLRLFAGEQWKVTAATGIFANAEALFNVNKENALVASDSTGATKGVDPFKDTRINGKAGITTTVWKRLSFGFDFAVKYDENPAPIALPAGATGFGPNYVAFSKKVDTLTEANLIFTLL